MLRYMFSTVLQKLRLHLYDTVLAIRYLLLSSLIRIMWLYILNFFWYPWICPAVHHHSRGDWNEINKLFSFICISQGICTRFHLFCRVYTTNPYFTHVINPYFPGFSSMQCGARTTVELSVKHDMGQFDNFQVILHIYGLIAVNEVPIIWAEYLCLYIYSDRNDDVISFYKTCFNINSETKYTTWWGYDEYFYLRNLLV